MNLVRFCSLCLALFFSAPLMTAESYNYSVDYAQCVKVYDNGYQPAQVYNTGYQANGQRVIRLYNNCPSKLYINACVVDNAGNTKLYQSAVKVPSHGNFFIYTFPDIDSTKIQLTAMTSEPVVPTLCKRAE